MFKFCFAFLIAGFAHTAYAITEEELKHDFMKHAMVCMKEHPVELTELMNLQKFVVPTKKEPKCLLACAYKSTGMMTKDGLYNLEKGYEVAELLKNGDEKRLENAKKLSEICVKVNEVEVSDGEQGCDRAGLMFKCGVENMPKLGFKL